MARSVWNMSNRWKVADIQDKTKSRRRKPAGSAKKAKKEVEASALLQEFFSPKTSKK